jgi:mono/diheme cytochrome c family protein
MSCLGWAAICDACGVDQLTMGTGLRFMIPVMAAAYILCLASAGTHVKTGMSGAWLKNVPLAAGERANPYAQDADAVAAGAKLFQRHCSSCHGKDANGTGRVPSLHSVTVKKASPGALFWLLRNGLLRRGMPSWSRLPDEQRWQIVTYLESIQDR